MSIKSLQNTILRTSGLNSGIDTEALVEAMSARTKLRIDMQNRQVQTLKWKQEAYRGVITKINDFKGKYFDMLKPKTNLLSTSLFNTRSIKSSSSAVSVTAANSALEGIYSLNVDSIATAQKITSSSNVTNGIKIDLDNTVEGEEVKVKIKLGTVEKEISFIGGENAVDNLNYALDKAFGKTNIGGVNSSRISVDSNGKLAATGGTDIYLTSVEGDIGITGTVSNKVSLNTKLSQIGFSTELVGDNYEFTINGEEFSFSGEHTIQEVINRINRSEAGVQMAFSSVSNTFSMTAKQLGSGNNIEISQSSGNLLSSLMGIGTDPNGSVTSRSLNTTKMDGQSFSYGEVIDDQFISSFDADNYNGKTFALEIAGHGEVAVELGEYASYEEMLADINMQIADKTGNSSVRATMKVDGENEATVSILSSAGAAITIKDNDGVLSSIGIYSGDTNSSIDKTFSEVYGISSGTIIVNGQSHDIDESTKISDIFDIDDTTGKTTINSFSATGDAVNALKEIFGASSFGGNETSAIFTDGTNAVFTIDGETIESANNSYTYGGITLSLTNAAVGAGEITLEVGRDTSSVAEVIKGFVEDYNTLIADLNSQILQKPDSDYPPLTDEQKESMNDTQIEKWEAKAREGLLYNDRSISSMLTSIRTALYSTVDGFSLADMGITTSKDWMENGKLIIDEAKLNSAIETNLEKVTSLFTNANEGIAAKVNNMLDSAVRTTGEVKGTLIQIAGAPTGITSVQNRLSDQLKDYAKVIQALEDRYEREQARYWSQFTHLEKVMGQLNSQSASIMNLFPQ
ncbi:MAG: flagellar filament capping protein FliD [Clostridiales bacterium]|nr:flagellar filament capping protein FliD [Clostridiales bacterium]